jgi:hypothetical protein
MRRFIATVMVAGSFLGGSATAAASIASAQSDGHAGAAVLTTPNPYGKR